MLSCAVLALGWSRVGASSELDEAQEMAHQTSFHRWGHRARLRGGPCERQVSWLCQVLPAGHHLCPQVPSSSLLPPSISAMHTCRAPDPGLRAVGQTNRRGNQKTPPVIS